MAVWDVSSAISNLRIRLGDAETDKFEFKADCIPTPDGITTRFTVGQARLVEGSLHVYAGGVEVTPGDVLDDQGTFQITPAPSGTTLQASFNYQWFSDVELRQFLNSASSLLGVVTMDDASLSTMLRPVVVEYAAYFAYMRKATSYADSVEAQAGGYTYGEGKSHPNWRALADAAIGNALKMLKAIEENPLTGTTKAKMRFVTLRQETYQPKS